MRACLHDNTVLNTESFFLSIFILFYFTYRWQSHQNNSCWIWEND